MNLSNKTKSSSKPTTPRNDNIPESSFSPVNRENTAADPQLTFRRGLGRYEHVEKCGLSCQKTLRNRRLHCSVSHQTHNKSIVNKQYCSVSA